MWSRWCIEGNHSNIWCKSSSAPNYINANSQTEVLTEEKPHPFSSIYTSYFSLEYLAQDVSFNKNLQGISKNAKKKKLSRWCNQHNQIYIWHGCWEFKITIINMLKALIKKMGNMQYQWTMLAEKQKQTKKRIKWKCCKWKHYNRHEERFLWSYP